MQMRLPVRTLANCYLETKSFVVGCGYEQEVAWQENLSFSEMTEREFLRESAWVILSSGMRETVVRRLFPEISEIFFDWCSAARIASASKHCELTALQIFNHPGKINAITKVAEAVALLGMEIVRDHIENQGVAYLESFPYLGPVTSLHLAKNLGIPVAKPDRHLVRLAAYAGYSSTEELCHVISDYLDEPVSVIDIVFWRALTILNCPQELPSIGTST